MGCAVLHFPRTYLVTLGKQTQTSSPHRIPLVPRSFCYQNRRAHHSRPPCRNWQHPQMQVRSKLLAPSHCFGPCDINVLKIDILMQPFTQRSIGYFCIRWDMKITASELSQQASTSDCVCAVPASEKVKKKVTRRIGVDRREGEGPAGRDELSRSVAQPSTRPLQQLEVCVQILLDE